MAPISALPQFAALLDLWQLSESLLYEKCFCNWELFLFCIAATLVLEQQEVGINGMPLLILIIHSIIIYIYPD